VISIKNPKIEKWIDEILRRSKFSGPLDYIEARVKQDYELVIKGKKLL
jgi:hypothetical protein